ncbi:hypothetical protein [Dietzia sp.]
MSSIFDLATGSLGSVGSSESSNPLPRVEEQHFPDSFREVWQNLPFSQPR